MANPIYDSMIELQCLNYVFQTNSFSLVSDNDITEHEFTTYKNHFKFLQQFVKEHNQLPSKETFQGKFGDEFEWLHINDPSTYLVGKLKEARLYRDLIVDYKKIATLIKEEKSDEAVALMGSVSQKFTKQQHQLECVDLIADAKSRYDSYIERVENHSKLFVSLGIKELDEILGGWDVQNESAVVAARTGVGKSWWLIFFATQAAMQGRTVGFYSGEMELDLVGYRMDTFLGGIANGSLTHGNDNVKMQYNEYINKLNSMVPGKIIGFTPEMIGGPATVGKIQTFIEKYNIDFMCIDQLSLMDDERKASRPREQMLNISKDLRTLQRLKKIPFIMAAQLNREENETGPTTKNLSEADRVGHDATTILFVERKDDRVIFNVGKARNAKTGDKLTYVWNVNMGTLHYMPTEKDAKKGSVDEPVVDNYNDTNKSNTIF